MRTGQVLTLITTGLGAAAVPLQSRDVISHDAVVGFAESASSVALKFKPWLKVVNGCVPFPAVDADGNTSGGLSPTGTSSAGCSSSTGQVYARATEYNGNYAIMYSWYMPKDSPSSGLGHRHDWEAAVVWIDDASASNPNIVALSTSAHGDFDTITSNFPLDGTRPKIRYFSNWPVNHQLGTTDEKGGEEPLIEWDKLTQAARDALTNTDFGSANVPFKDANFQDNLGKAAP
ncbi:NPP1-domain-containing protein [Biscogniauxia marginata]|nr:NPP1-domain-containing protein [Biscogniauxia marginata]